MKKLLVTIQSVLLLLFLLYFSSSIVFVVCEDEIGKDSTSSSLAPMEKTEQEALYSAIQSFVGKWWNGSDLYPDPCGWTPIQGVYCDLYDGLWYISDLNIGPIYDNSLKCSVNAKISNHLFNLKHLKALSIFSCFVSQNLNPVTISTLRWEKFTHSLESLEFRLNPGLIGTVPTTIGKLTKLQSLVLLENGLTGELPMEIGNLANLRKLVLSGNHFLGQIPSSFGQLSELLILDTSRNDLSGSLPSSLGFLRSLLKLDLSNNMLNGILPREIGKLKNLTLLDLGSNKFSGGLPESLGEMVSLNEMVISNNPVGGDLKRNIEWRKLLNLEILDLSNTSLTGDIPESLAEMKRLRFLGLNYNNLSGNVPPRLASLPCISTLYLGGNNLTGELGFSEGFYRKMGRRFGAWNNPNLCYRLTSSTCSYAPYGVRPCNQESNTYKRVSNEKVSRSVDRDRNTTDDFFSVRSSGILRCSVGGFWHLFCVQGMLVMFLWSAMFISITCTDFAVGDEYGWKTPKSKNDSQIFNNWASKNRFIVGDTLHFEYDKDSVLAVTEEEYEKCYSSHPVYFSNNGDSVFHFDRPGLFYFISGVSGHCERGQKMIIKVLETAHPPQSGAEQNTTIGTSQGNAAPGFYALSSPTFVLFLVSFVGPVLVV
ncbi:hypothetical protein F8388_019974 [Cannabis sativa]|uniref:Phytocyanin domain-containing protein n=1 Tax=Cannabis sativa TaxID=3483 RepID=A0A7J6GTV5_CANSA|nr:hypothetical protein F8388_019974 [Cannabis sativa]